MHRRPTRHGLTVTTALLSACLLGGCASFNDADGDAGADGSVDSSDGAVVDGSSQSDARTSGGDGGVDGQSGDATTGAGDGGVASDSGSGFPLVTLPDGAVVFPTNDAGQVLCGNEPCLCSDGIDNDDDGLVDGFDPECTGPYDNDESSFATGISGDNKDRHQDCFFDGNSGGGKDDCMIDEVCLLDRDSQDCLDSFSGKRTLEEEEAKCADFCEPRTPNGCDCFGCCEIFTAEGSTAVLLDPACQVEIDSDGHATLGGDCRTCEPSPVCGNECGECELCVGRTVDDLPDSCRPPPPEDGGVGQDGGSGGGDAGTGTKGDGGTGSEDPPGYECIDGAGNPQQACDAKSPCSLGYYCSLGCCIPQLF